MYLMLFYTLHTQFDIILYQQKKDFYHLDIKYCNEHKIL